jgi:putative transposase
MNTRKSHISRVLIPVPQCPYLLGGIAIERVNQVWCSDITYIPMAKGFLYLVIVMDWVSRAVLAWRLSNTLGADFWVEALKEATSRFQTWAAVLADRVTTAAR